MNNHVTTLEIDASAIEHNLKFLSSKLKPSTKKLIVVKAFGYGGSSIEIAKYLAPKVDYFAVAYLDEGIAIRNAGVTTPILVLHPQLKNIPLFFEYNLEPTIYSKAILEALIKFGENKNQEFPIHIKFNTGLNRLGFATADLDYLIETLESNKQLKVTSLFSHLAASEDHSEKDFTLEQIDSFEKMSNRLCKDLAIQPLKHILNTSGVLNYADKASFDMVRIGIGLYGFGNDEVFNAHLKSVFRLTSIISQIHTVEKNKTIGYNRAFTALRKTKTATVPIGHADGISRLLGKGVGYVYISGKKAHIIGNVCMDMIMVDVSDIDCKEGDVVEIYRDNAHIESLAEKSQTISYEILTSISQRINRVFNK